MRLLLISTATIAAMMANPCAAQDKPDFSGFRLEALGGYDNISSGGEGDDGFVYGAAAGYDAALGRTRLGVEGEITDSTVRDRSRDVLTAGDRLRSDAGRDFYIGVRAGYVISPKLMAYAKAGYTNARVTTRYNSATEATRDSENLDGFRLGAGLEYAISPRFFVRGEYRYSHYGDQNGADIDADRHQLMAGVGVRF
ncbi:outer membrane immunogenic protein [Sphingomonas sp. OV641]|uniref:outer membrane protein n=1 Tax=Sphingomonas sp. OV641 TaxID=1881068 RepID=UPI0008D54B47|nr:outer membrane beta-barrel protein [Sphingomonas sp. OV641]SEJ23367.1 outer membrane immunogenic protein [Sphingomonas sp. OV641]